MQKGWILGSAVGCALALAVLAFYFVIISPTTSPVAANQITGSDGRRPGLASPDDPVRAVVSQSAAESRRERGNAFSAPKDFSKQGKPFYEFSGITTIDPDSPSTTPTAQPSPEPEELAKAPQPLVFQSVSSSLVKVTPEQEEVIDRLKQNFLDMMGSAPQDPNDPKYLERWEEAQPLIDEQLKTQLGQDFFLRYERATHTATKQ